ncbi:hypothetical protein CN97_03130 [Haematobacter massiliensis]|uniref:Uncharacterized protein n=1 Tax=Haematobacter massiliensis TaxID=195105 RepID=A0A086XXA8_9RHOB|nr:hypothetical protein [Haematobacter massiliensis]KFI26658.1 hypothetical protein CN97_03130 [Haematobacter massiliensis]
MERLREQLCAAVRRAVAGDRIADRITPPEAGFGLWQAFVALSARSYGSAGLERSDSRRSRHGPG